MPFRSRRLHRAVLLSCLLLLLVAATGPAGEARAAATQESLPPGAEQALDRLNTSPRHGEFVDIPYGEGKPPLRSYVVWPERKDKAGVVIVIMEIYGLSAWLRGVADQLAADGFIAIAPDLISGMGPGGGGTDSAATRDDLVKLVRALTPEETLARLAAVRDYGVKLPGSNGKWGTVGFCWGGAASFRVAGTTPPPDVAVVYYGTSPDSAWLPRVTAPVQGHYGEDDARVNVTIEPARLALHAAGRTYEPHLYKGAGHGFLRQQDGREGANLAASREAWPRTLEFLRKHLK